MVTSVKFSAPQLEDKLETLAKSLFDDPRVRSLGIGGNANEPLFVAVRNSAVIMPYSASYQAEPTSFAGLAIKYEDTPGEIDCYLTIPVIRPMASNVIEQQMRRPLCIGQEVQNFDADNRSGFITQGMMTVGTLGCFVQNGNKFAMLSNNHVLAGENSGRIGSDRILQPGDGQFTAELHVATLSKSIDLVPSMPSATLANRQVHLNLVDASIADLIDSIDFEQHYHDNRPGLPKIKSFGDPVLGDKVIKVGRTTGLTRGEVKQVTSIVGPVAYKPGLCWFRRSFVIEGINGSKFSDHGDSGSAIVTEDGKLLGLLYAGNGRQTYACPITEVFTALDIRLV